MRPPALAVRIFHYLNLDYLIAPFLIKLVYWIGVVVIASAGIGGLFASIETSDTGMRLTLTVVATLLSLLLWRLFSELLILAFNVYARLVEIRDLLSFRRAKLEMPRKTAGLSILKNQRLNPAIKVQHD